MRSRRMQVAGIDALAIRVSFTGDLGWEVYVDEADQLALYSKLLEAGEDTIYDAGWGPYGDDPLVSFNASQLMKADLEGGITGAIGCALVGDFPTQYAIDIGGVVAGVDSSIADIISQLSSYW